MNKQLKNYYLFIIGLTIFSVGLQFILPFPFGFLLSLGFVIAMPIITRIMAKRLHNKAGKFGGLEEGSKISKTCMTCGKQTNITPCPRCGRNSFKYR